MGEHAYLSMPMTAFFASRQCPGVAIRAATDWAQQQAKSSQAVISGFHSPLEQSVLQILLQARSPVVAVLARPLTGAQFPAHWKEAITSGKMAVISVTATPARLTIERAIQRNDLAARLAKTIVVAYASNSGTLAKQLNSWLAQGWLIKKLADF